MSTNTLSVHPENPRCFLFRGKPFRILTSAEHYGAVLNGAFDYDVYLEEMARTGQNGTRVFTFYREEGDRDVPSIGYANTLAPAPSAAVMPWQRVEGQGDAPDGLPRFDLDRWNDAYFQRLKAYVRACDRHGVVCEIVLFCNPYDQRRLDLFPCSPLSNVNGVGGDLTGPGSFMSLDAPSIVAFQERFITKIVSELNEFDNVYYEICNEPTAGPGQDPIERAPKIAAWHRHLARAIREAERGLPRRHLVAANLHLRTPARDAGSTSKSPSDLVVRHDEEGLASFAEIDVINYHYISSMATVRGTRFVRLPGPSREAGLLWAFMRARDDIGKPIVFDETYTGVIHSAPERYPVTRAEAWETMLSGGAGYSSLDWSFTPKDPSGSGHAPIDDGRRLDGRSLREWLNVLRGVLKDTDLGTLAPADGLLARPPSQYGTAASVDGRGVCLLYLVDERVYWMATPEPRALTLRLNLPTGTHKVRAIDPCSGGVTELPAVAGGRDVAVTLPAFTEDIALMIE